MQGIVYEHQASAAIDTARFFWPRIDDVIETLEWTLLRDPSAGTALYPGSPLRVVVFEGAKSVGMPTVTCTFERKTSGITFHDLEFEKK